jgi:aminoglycoside 6-adenylyltransferase
MDSQSLLAIREQMCQRILEWGIASADIRALALVGSGARSDHPADQWSDIDLLMITSRPDGYLQSTAWVNGISDPWISTLERDPLGKVVERRVLFQNGIDVDFLVLGSESIDRLHEMPFCEIIQRGIRVLLDKDHILENVRNEQPPDISAHTPSLEEFCELVDDFWFHAVWTAKKLKRGELWTAKSCCDIYLKKLLLALLEWHSHALQGWEETWYNGRFIESWSSERVLARLSHVFAHYDEDDLWRALLNTLELFDEIGRETARLYSYPYPAQAALDITGWLAVLRNGSGSTRIEAG